MKSTTALMAAVWLALSAAYAAPREAPQLTSAQVSAEEAWTRRSEPGKTSEAIHFWQEALQQDSRRHDLLIPLTKACGRAYRHAETSADKIAWAENALRYGEAAAAKNPDSSLAHAFYAEALGQWAQSHKGFRGLNNVKKAVHQLENAIALDPHNHYAHMLLAEFYRSAPRGISVGNHEKALIEAQRAVQEGPEYAINHLVLGRVYLEKNQKEAARKEFEMMLTLPPPADAIPETESDQATARDLIKTL